MADKRQVYRLILQVMSYIGVGAILWVMFSSAFVGHRDDERANPVERIEMSLQQLKSGEMTHVMWMGKKVSVLHQRDGEKTSTKMPPYYVFFNVGDSGNCPLFFAGKRLKDTCTGTLYDQNGQPIGRSRADDLVSPPHYFLSNDLLIIGEKKRL